MKTAHVFLFALLINFGVQSMEHKVSDLQPIDSELKPSIELLQEDRDMSAIEKILNEYPAKLTFESLGYEKGTTKKYLLSPKYTTKVLRVGNKTVGFINYMVFEPPFILNWFMSPKGIILLLGVDSDHQSQGYGRMLLRDALAELKKKNLPTAWLSVKRDNKIARSFYEKEGFICTIPQAYRQYFSDLAYEKKL